MATTGQTFSPFKRLPLEIQDAIWKCAIDSISPRVIELRKGVRAMNYNQFPHQIPTWIGNLTSSCPIPSMLHACQRSRWLALKRWKLSFAFGKGWRNPPTIFFDFAHDTLLLHSSPDNGFASLNDFAADVNSRDRKALRKIAFSERDQFYRYYHSDGYSLARQLHRDFPALTNVIFLWTEKSIKNAHYEPIHEDLPNLKKPIITFFRESRGRVNRNLVGRFLEEYRRHGWAHPQLDYMSYYRTNPNTVQILEDEDWYDFELRMRRDKGGQWMEVPQFYGLRSFRSMLDGYLEEVNDLELRAILLRHPV
jgi:hypothetical protein